MWVVSIHCPSLPFSFFLSFSFLFFIGICFSVPVDDHGLIDHSLLSFFLSFFLSVFQFKFTCSSKFNYLLYSFLFCCLKLHDWPVIFWYPILLDSFSLSLSPSLEILFTLVFYTSLSWLLIDHWFNTYPHRHPPTIISDFFHLLSFVYSICPLVHVLSDFFLALTSSVSKTHTHTHTCLLSFDHLSMRWVTIWESHFFLYFFLSLFFFSFLFISLSLSWWPL